MSPGVSPSASARPMDRPNAFVSPPLAPGGFILVVGTELPRALPMVDPSSPATTGAAPRGPCTESRTDRGEIPVGRAGTRPASMPGPSPAAGPARPRRPRRIEGQIHGKASHETVPRPPVPPVSPDVRRVSTGEAIRVEAVREVASAAWRQTPSSATSPPLESPSSPFGMAVGPGAGGVSRRGGPIAAGFGGGRDHYGTASRPSPTRPGLHTGAISGPLQLGGPAPAGRQLRDGRRVVSGPRQTARTTTEIGGDPTAITRIQRVHLHHVHRLEVAPGEGQQAGPVPPGRLSTASIRTATCGPPGSRSGASIAARAGWPGRRWWCTPSGGTASPGRSCCTGCPRSAPAASRTRSAGPPGGTTSTGPSSSGSDSTVSRSPTSRGTSGRSWRSSAPSCRPRPAPGGGTSRRIAGGGSGNITPAGKDRPGVVAVPGGGGAAGRTSRRTRPDGGPTTSGACTSRPARPPRRRPGAAPTAGGGVPPSTWRERQERTRRAEADWGRFEQAEREHEARLRRWTDGRERRRGEEERRAEGRRRRAFEDLLGRSSAPPWHEVLGLSPTATRDEIRRRVPGACQAAPPGHGRRRGPVQPDRRGT